jgi:hypothetical protein
MKPAAALCAIASFSIAGGVFIASCGPSSDGATHPGADGGTGGNACVKPPADADGDNISDADEGAAEKPPRDTDGDGTPDYKDADSDNDGIPDAVEGGNFNPCTLPIDSDADGKPDFQDVDSDSATNSTVGDREEAGADPMHPVDTNGDGRPDYLDPDDDGDGIPDLIELTPLGQPVAATKLADAPDSDGDGVPDFRDTDSDGDTVADLSEGNVDTDGDLIPNYRDLDSDNDCIPDALEAGDADPATPPVDTDGDMTPDFEDTDSDSDGLVDGKEDKNCNGVTDACETDRKKIDTDGDMVSDLIEFQDCAVKSPAQQQATMCLCDGSNPAASPLTHGDFVFVVDYMLPPDPMVETLSLGTDVSQADVIFSFDSTGSMGNAIANLKTKLAGLVPTIKQKVSSIAFGLVDFQDFPSEHPGDVVTRYDYRITTVNTQAGLMAMQASLNALTAPPGVGGDQPEAGWEALYSIAGGPAINITSYSSVFNLAATTPNPAPAGESQGTVGGAGFRAGSVPVIVAVSDAEWHDAPGSAVAGDAESGLNQYGSGHNGAPSRRAAITRTQALNAHVVGVAGHGTGATGNPKLHMIATANETGAVVKPADFGPVGVRPAGCAITDCCTADNGAGEPAQGGLCPLVFSFDDANGNGVSDSVVSAIVALANGLKFDIHVEATDVDPLTVDRFMLKLIPNLTGAGPAAMCITMTPSPLQDNFSGPKAAVGGDGTLDTFPGIGGGSKICFDVIPKMNTSVMNTDQPQFFHALLQVKGVAGGNTVNLGVPRDVFFLVPPKIKNGPIP